MSFIPVLALIPTDYNPVFWGMRSAVPSPLAVCALWESLSDFQLCEGFNRPSVLTVLSGIVAPRVFQPSNIHQYFASALTYCSLSPCLDRFIRSPGRRWKLTNYFGWVDSSSCVPPPLSNSHSQSQFFASALTYRSLSPCLDRLISGPFLLY